MASPRSLGWGTESFPSGGSKNHLNAGITEEGTTFRGS